MAREAAKTGATGATGEMGAAVRQALAWAKGVLAEAGVPEPTWDASLLMAWALGEPRTRVLTAADRLLTGDEARRFAAAVARRAQREPLQYITGRQGFMGLQFTVDPRVLVPRPDTEVLVEAVLQFTRSLPGAEPLSVADLGTGSGAIAVALAAHAPRLRLAAVDLSPDALAVARQNAEGNGVADRIEFLAGDLLAPLAGRRFAAIACNPPYIDPAEAGSLAPEVAEHEPGLALFSPAGALAFYRRLAAGAGRYLQPGSLLAVEVGFGQAPAVADIFAQAWRLDLAPADGAAHGLAASGLPAHLAPVPAPGSVQVRRDYGGVDRVVLARLG